MFKAILSTAVLVSLAGAIAGQAVLAQPTASAASLEVTVTGITTVKGSIRLALCPPQADFPDCRAKAVRAVTMPVTGGSVRILLGGLPPGTYAISVFHDANNNGKLDTFAGIPKEGYGFSRNPAFKPRAPKFEEAQIAVSGPSATAIKLRYIL